MDETALLVQFEPKSGGKTIVHEHQLFQARFSPCGNYLIASGYDATVQRWDLREEEPRRMTPCTGHHAWIQCMAFIPGSQRMVSADSWGQLAVWNYAEETPAPVWKNEAAHDGWIRAIAVSPDGATIATGGNDRNIRLWSAMNGTLIKEWDHPDKVFSLCFHPHEASLVSGGLKGLIRVWEINTAAVQREINAAVLYQHDKIQECGGVRHLTFDLSGKQLACAGQKTPGGGFATGFPCVLVFDWDSGTQLREMQVGANDDGFAYDAVFHPAGFVMATSCAFPGKGSVWFWMPAQEKAFYQSNQIPNGRSLSLHPDGQQVALLVSQSPNANGRVLVDGVYQGGSAKIHLLKFAAADATAHLKPEQTIVQGSGRVG